MCFSLEASFVAGGVLIAVGTVTAIRARKSRALPYALIPVFFGIQQVIEGFQWLSIGNGSPNTLLGYGFLFFAFLWWPFYIPYAISEFEKDSKRKKFILGIMILGLLVSAYHIIILLTQTLTVGTINHCIDYQINIPFRIIDLTIYGIAVCGSGVLSTRPLVKLFGAVVFIGLAVSLFIFQETFISVWCFFAAALSAVVFAEVYSLSKKKLH
jgi:hypothetical protein